MKKKPDSNIQPIIIYRRSNITKSALTLIINYRMFWRASMLKVNNLVKDYVIDSDAIRVLDGLSFEI
ncbi:MAG: hypothetical protein WAW23_01335, partial [Candidatus Methanoperedens sp.]